MSTFLPFCMRGHASKIVDDANAIGWLCHPLEVWPTEQVPPNSHHFLVPYRGIPCPWPPTTISSQACLGSSGDQPKIWVFTRSRTDLSVKLHREAGRGSSCLITSGSNNASHEVHWRAVSQRVAPSSSRKHCFRSTNCKCYSDFWTSKKDQKRWIAKNDWG